MLPKSVQMAWNALYLLGDEWKKALVIEHELSSKFNMKVTQHYLYKVLNQLVYGGFIKGQTGHGFKRSNLKKIYLVDVMRLFDVKYKISTDNPAGRLQFKIYQEFEKVFFDNTKEISKEG